MRIVTIPGVLSPRSDASMLAEALRDRGLARAASVLDVFTGSGVLAVAAALSGADAVVATDISRRAVLNAKLNARLNRSDVEVLRGDLFAPVANRRFDLIVANPPYLPGTAEAFAAAGASLAWEGGLDGRALLDRFCWGAVEYLRPGGTVLVVQSSLSGEQATLDRLAQSGLRTEVIARRRGPLGPIASARAHLLEQRGVLKAGEREEELLVIGGRREA